MIFNATAGSGPVFYTEFPVVDTTCSGAPTTNYTQYESTGACLSAGSDQVSVRVYGAAPVPSVATFIQFNPSVGLKAVYNNRASCEGASAATPFSTGVQFVATADNDAFCTAINGTHYVTGGCSNDQPALVCPTNQCNSGCVRVPVSTFATIPKNHN